MEIKAKVKDEYVDKKEICKNCDRTSFYCSGEELQLKKSVSALQQNWSDDNQLVISGKVCGNYREFYHVSLTLNTENPDYEIEDYKCNCAAYRKYIGMCKHCIALGLEYIEMESAAMRGKVEEKTEKAKKKKSDTSSALANALNLYNAASHNQISSGIQKGTVHLDIELRTTRGVKSSRNEWKISCRIGVDRMYVVKDIALLVHNVLNGVDYQYGKQLKFVHTLEMFDEESRRILKILEQAVFDQVYDIDSHWNCQLQYRSIRCSNDEISQVLHLYSGGEIIIDNLSYPIVEENPSLYLCLSAEKRRGAWVKIPCIEELCMTNHGYYLYEDTIYHCTEDFVEKVLPFFRLATIKGYNEDFVTEFLSKEDYRSFCGNVLPMLSPYVDIQLERVDLSKYMPQTPEFSFYLTRDDALCLKPMVRYGSADYPLFYVHTGEYRCSDLEEPVKGLILQYFTTTSNPEILKIMSEDALFLFLKQGMDALREKGEVFVEDSLKSMRIRQTPNVQVGLRLAGGLLDVDIHSEELSQEEMEQLLHAYQLKKRYYRLENGDFFSLEDGSLAVLSEMCHTVEMNGKTHGQVPEFRAKYINDLLTDENANIDLKRSTDFKKLIRTIRDYRDSDYDVPETLNASLHSYQKDGFRWMATLADCGLGGILADDMGLGKTIQVITLLLYLQSTALVVCPASLLYNWQSEIERFAPTLRVQLVTGTADTRRSQIEQLADVYITSYDLFRRDVELYKVHTYGCCILDEAQYIRNPETQAAKAVKTVQAKHRFALTGTPISNRLVDIWSVFDFLMPGYLYRYLQFRKEMEKPILDGDKMALAQLQRMTALFILRRKKEDVLRELPEKVTNVHYVEMTKEQSLLYRTQEQQMRQQLLNATDVDVSRDQIKLLAALTRMRQLCCTPELYLENYHGGSGKVDACMELLCGLKESGHHALVFSQFTTMLEALLEEANRHGLNCLYLSGKDSKEKRRDMVNAFQSGAYDVFFLSLKAEGTGLNLTAADHVIHFDPWWNAAAEDQATDRVYRMGQDKTVFVTKLVTKGTIEERIVDLQNAKRELSDQVISGGASLDGNINRDALLELLSESED